MNLNSTQQRLININIAWNDYEENMGENAALEIACQEEGVSSQWFYDNYADHADVVNDECARIWEEKAKS